MYSSKNLIYLTEVVKWLKPDILYAPASNFSSINCEALIKERHSDNDLSYRGSSDSPVAILRFSVRILVPEKAKELIRSSFLALH